MDQKNKTKKSTNKNTNTQITKKDILEIKELLKKNLHYLKSLSKFTEKVNKFIVITQVKTVLKILIIILPLILAYFYFIPLFEDIAEKYKNLYNTLGL